MKCRQFSSGKNVFFSFSSTNKTCFVIAYYNKSFLFAKLPLDRRLLMTTAKPFCLKCFLSRCFAFTFWLKIAISRRILKRITKIKQAMIVLQGLRKDKITQRKKAVWAKISFMNCVYGGLCFGKNLIMTLILILFKLSEK